MISKINLIAIIALIISLLHQSIALNSPDQLQYKQDTPSNQVYPIHNNQIHSSVTLGHYDFEVAPKMEPPSVRKPPYLQSTQVCPGSGFSPKDTLCGDLNQGRLPLNPLGQSVHDQSYPFELIKNKTLQFLARALPVLKLEYETIPKVARYLSPNQLLNPTHGQSPLISEHMHQLNQRLSTANSNGDFAVPYSRRKRSPRGGATIAELSPNATLVVSSSGRIQVANPESSAVITKDGYKSINKQQVASRYSWVPQQQQSVHDNKKGTSSGPLSASNVSLPVESRSGSMGVQGRSSQEKGESSGQQQQQVAAKQTADMTSKRSRLSCSESSNGFTSAICQAVSTLIEGNQAPVWMQLVKHLGNAYSADAQSGSGAVLSLISSLTQEPKNSQTSAAAKANLMSILSPLSSLLGVSSGKDSENKESGAISKLALAGWASALGGLFEYIVPAVFGQSANRAFAKRKKPFDPQETFVDTPASVAAALSARNSPLSGKQPPTPCPSVEEYISPTFARNYQGTWKYVVQIPHEGYFTQTIQRTSCVRKRCEFTEGVCHESPRWVSLLVAEIYYPNAVFGGQQAANEQPINGNQLAAASSSNARQTSLFQQSPKQSQDPLQMTDSLSNYNHNLNNAFINAANELGWDPNNVANMQHLANAYNYQLMQRNGLQTAEARSSNIPTQYNSAQFNSDYILALASAALQQNPNMNINDLINSLQVQQRRKKRDLNQANNRLQRPQQQQQFAMDQAHLNAQRSALLETVPSINEISANQANSNSNQQQYKQQQQVATNLMAEPHQVTTGAADPPAQPQQAIASDTNQVECDGHDKIGCYVVRVYYDWFLVNGSCKCWKTGATGSQTGGSGSANSFLRRIFTG